MVPLSVRRSRNNELPLGYNNERRKRALRLLTPLQKQAIAIYLFSVLMLCCGGWALLDHGRSPGILSAPATMSRELGTWPSKRHQVEALLMEDHGFVQPRMSDSMLSPVREEHVHLESANEHHYSDERGHGPGHHEPFREHHHVEDMYEHEHMYTHERRDDRFVDPLHEPHHQHQDDRHSLDRTKDNLNLDDLGHQNRHDERSDDSGPGKAYNTHEVNVYHGPAHDDLQREQNEHENDAHYHEYGAPSYSHHLQHEDDSHQAEHHHEDAEHHMQHQQASKSGNSNNANNEHHDRVDDTSNNHWHHNRGDNHVTENHERVSNLFHVGPQLMDNGEGKAPSRPHVHIHEKEHSANVAGHIEILGFNPTVVEL